MPWTVSEDDAAEAGRMIWQPGRRRRRRGTRRFRGQIGVQGTYSTLPRHIESEASRSYARSADDGTDCRATRSTTTARYRQPCFARIARRRRISGWRIGYHEQEEEGRTRGASSEGGVDAADIPRREMRLFPLRGSPRSDREHAEPQRDNDNRPTFETSRRVQCRHDTRRLEGGRALPSTRRSGG